MPTPRHGNWHNEPEEDEPCLADWFPAVRFDDPDSFDVDPPDED